MDKSINYEEEPLQPFLVYKGSWPYNTQIDSELVKNVLQFVVPAEVLTPGANSFACWRTTGDKKQMAYTDAVRTGLETLMMSLVAPDFYPVAEDVSTSKKKSSGKAAEEEELDEEDLDEEEDLMAATTETDEEEEGILFENDESESESSSESYMGGHSNAIDNSSTNSRKRKLSNPSKNSKKIILSSPDESSEEGGESGQSSGLSTPVSKYSSDSLPLTRSFFGDINTIHMDEISLPSRMPSSGSSETSSVDLNIRELHISKKNKNKKSKKTKEPPKKKPSKSEKQKADKPAEPKFCLMTKYTFKMPGSDVIHPRYRIFVQFVPKKEHVTDIFNFFAYENMAALVVSVALFEPDFNPRKLFSALIRNNNELRKKYSKQRFEFDYTMFDQPLQSNPNKGSREIKLRQIVYQDPYTNKAIKQGYETITSPHHFYLKIVEPLNENIQEEFMQNEFKNMPLNMMGSQLDVSIFFVSKAKDKLRTLTDCSEYLSLKRHYDENRPLYKRNVFENNVHGHTGTHRMRDEAAPAAVFAFKEPISVFEVDPQDLGGRFFCRKFPWTTVLENNPNVSIYPIGLEEADPLLTHFAYRDSALFNYSAPSASTDECFHNDVFYTIQQKYKPFVDYIHEAEERLPSLSNDKRKIIYEYKENVHNVILKEMFRAIEAGKDMCRSMRAMSKIFNTSFKTMNIPNHRCMPTIVSTQEPFNAPGIGVVYREVKKEVALSPFAYFEEFYLRSVMRWNMTNEAAYLAKDMYESIMLLFFPDQHFLKIHHILVGEPATGKSTTTRYVIDGLVPELVRNDQYESDKAYASGNVWYEENHTIKVQDEIENMFFRRGPEDCDPKTIQKINVMLEQLTSNKMTIKRSSFEKDENGKMRYATKLDSGPMHRIFLLSSMYPPTHNGLVSRFDVCFLNNKKADIIALKNTSITSEDKNNQDKLKLRYLQHQMMAFLVGVMRKCGCGPDIDISIIQIIQMKVIQVLNENNIPKANDPRYTTRVHARYIAKLLMYAFNMMCSEVATDMYTWRFDEKIRHWLPVPVQFQPTQLLQLQRYMFPNEEIAIAAAMCSIHEVVPEVMTQVIMLLFVCLAHLNPIVFAEWVKIVDEEQEILDAIELELTKRSAEPRDLDSMDFDEEECLHKAYKNNPQKLKQAAVFMDNKFATEPTYVPVGFNHIVYTRGHVNPRMILNVNECNPVPFIQADSPSIKKFDWSIFDHYESLHEYKTKVPFAPPISFMTNQIYEPTNPYKPEATSEETLRALFNNSQQNVYSQKYKRNDRNNQFIMLNHVVFKKKVDVVNGQLNCMLDINYVLLHGVSDVKEISTHLSKQQNGFQEFMNTMQQRVSRVAALRKDNLQRWYENSDKTLTPEQIENYMVIGERQKAIRTIPTINKNIMQNIINGLDQTSVSFPVLPFVSETSTEREIIQYFLPENVAKLDRSPSPIFQTTSAGQVYINIFALVYNHDRLIDLILYLFGCQCLVAVLVPSL